MNIPTKQDIDKPIGGLFFMIINTSIWAFITEYYLENKDQRLVGILLGLVISSFLYFYLKFTKAQKNLPESNVEKTDEEKRMKNGF
ncbi:hypothetical protein SAMN05444397_102184 [Flavobacterium aquidurense]|uniref:F0F1-ATPase subunit Ca2+/Mg2+ transporter n=1 Tax=Flavobacterium frigidimaris TaxID=262320 RepID=A0ABX4BTM0_FLAFR|nr:hypothetical protein [Flavobacterium frigidimaris]OXA80416.1 hypothetical protein B0A65_07240 [Flavobacterium frigidimaris]SDY76443.1 hypothetical protein SAMN05444397_102184 [Flavobacterium aquidurense]